jgi:acetolactate synthase-1/2/3 large subunit
MDWLVEAGYTHCFYVSGGNVMHLLESASHRFTCVPFVHEVGATIAADYFNEISITGQKSFVIVTAGPGLTNAITGIAGAWTDSRELLIIGGQAKSSELSKGNYRQIGFQEIDGVNLIKSITKAAIRVDSQISKQELFKLVNISKTPRKGPVFIEVCLDISTQDRDKLIEDHTSYEYDNSKNILFDVENVSLISKEISQMITDSARPLILIGAGISRNTNLNPLFDLEIPIATTFNGADRVGMDYEYYSGKPNWYGSRWSNILVQQSDLIIALGTRLGIMQVGYNWEAFAPKARIVQVEIDAAETTKGFPKVDSVFLGDCNLVAEQIPSMIDPKVKNMFSEWKKFVKIVRSDLNYPEKANKAGLNYVESSSFIFDLMKITSGNEVIIPCSSGAAAYESAMRVISNKGEQLMVTSHALASMGYGLSGAIGAALAYPEKKTIMFEGDGGFAQNLQELGTAVINGLNLKIFIMDNSGYQSIRGNQKNSFAGHYVGCDKTTGLGLPDWEKISIAFGAKTYVVTSITAFSEAFLTLFNNPGLVTFIVKIDPEQTYWPRLMSSINADGDVISNPLHQMYPPLNESDNLKYIKYIR